MKKNLSIVLILLTGMLTSACDFDLNLEKTHQRKYLALGDSYTIGESVNTQKSFPYQLTDSLIERGIPMYAPTVVAKTGWTTDELNEGINNAGITGKFDIVTLLIGVNNQFRGRDTASYRIEFRNLLERAIAFSRNDAEGVIVLSIPDWGVTPFAQNYEPSRIAREIDTYNRIGKSESKSADVFFVEITDISRTKYDGEYLLAPDDLHPSGEMYSKWVERILPKATEILEVE